VKRPVGAGRYGSFPTTADVGLWASGGSDAQMFSALGKGLFALMTDLRRVRPTEARHVSASADDPAGLVVAFLSELLLLEADGGFLGRQVTARSVGSPPTAVLAIVRGERFDPDRHSRRKEVKAVTLHQLRVDLRHHRTRVILDI
jgi:SHS2 domain-containing protein